MRADPHRRTRQRGDIAFTAGMLQFHCHFSLRVFAHRDGLHAEIAADSLDAGELFNRQENAVDRAVSSRHCCRLGHAILQHP